MARNLEDKMQEACVRWFDMQYPEMKQLLIHVPNGGKRNVLEAAKFKRMGVRAGVADLVLFVPNRFHSAFFIEMKVGKSPQRESQKIFESEVKKQGYKYEVCRSIEQFIVLVEGYMDQVKKNA